MLYAVALFCRKTKLSWATCYIAANICYEQDIPVIPLTYFHFKLNDEKNTIFDVANNTKW